MLTNTKCLFLSLIILSLLTACGGGGGGGGERNIGPTISNTSPATINEGEEATLTVSASDSDGFIREVRWLQTAGPRVSFTNGRQSITFDAPLVDEDTVLSFSVDAVDDFGAIASVDLSVTVLNNSGTKASLMITQISAVSSWFDHHWLEVENVSDIPLNLKDYSIVSTGYDINLNIVNNYTLSFPDYELATGERTHINLSVLDVNWSFTGSISAIQSSEKTLLPDWQSNGFIEVINMQTMQSEDVVRLGNNTHQPSSIEHGNISTIELNRFPMANFYTRQGKSSWQGLVGDR